MTAPNMVNTTSIVGKTAFLAVTTSATAILSNAASSGKVIKVNMLSVANIDGTNTADITATIVRSAVSRELASTVPVPPDTTLVILSKDIALYLEEGDDLKLTASASGDLVGTVSYEEIS